MCHAYQVYKNRQLIVCQLINCIFDALVSFGRFLTALKNGQKEDIFRCESDPQTSIGRSSTVFFSYNLVAGDQVAVNSGNFNLFDFAKLTGFLLPNSNSLGGFSRP